MKTASSSPSAPRAARAPRGGAGPLWMPSAQRVARANLTRFTATFRPGADYDALWRWSVDRPEEFWPAVWEFCGVVAEERAGGPPWEAVLEGGERMAPPDPVLGPRWFRGARLNFAANLLRFAEGGAASRGRAGDDGRVADDRRAAEREALVSWNERGRRGSLTYAELGREVARYQAALCAAGVGVGDRVAALLPNIPETVALMLATTSLGAVWSSCSPDFGERAVLDRFGQIRPKVLFAVDGYLYGGKTIDLRERVRQVAEALPATRTVVVVPYAGFEVADVGSCGVPRAVSLARFAPPVDAVRPDFVRLPFDHPAVIAYSSGTTGLPKCIVHGAGGILLQHLKELVLHTDLGPDDRIFYFTTCGWMMWNWLVSSLAVGATVVLYDGAPMAGRSDLLWMLAEQERLTIFGTSARYLALCEKEGLEPGREHDLSRLRTILSTGSPLAPHSFDWVYGAVKHDLHLASISGGTDILSCFALGDPTGPVWRGELQRRGLGMAVDVLDPKGRSVTGAPGELVCARPFPSMPVAFWDDPDGARYRAAYFAHFPGVWRHGDWAHLTRRGGLVIHGRSDATLNPGGVRIGTAEITRTVELLPEIVESLVVGQEWEEDVRIVLFVRLRDGAALDEALRERIRREVRAHASPHHVPRRVVQVADLPRTMSGKLSELAVRAVIHGRPVENADALANPQALELFRGLPELAT